MKYIAYYLFKHRIGCDYENEGLVDNMKLREALDNAVLNCWKMLYHGENSYTYGGGGCCMKYEAIPKFKRRVIKLYNDFAEGKYEIIDKDAIQEYIEMEKKIKEMVNYNIPSDSIYLRVAI